MALSTLFEELRELTRLDAPSGFEEPVLQACRTRFEQLGAAVEIDVRGNLYADLKTPTSNPDCPVVMITAHADEIGFMVTSILPQGFLRFTHIGHPTQTVLPGQRIRLLLKDRTIPGVIGARPGHLLSAENRHSVPALQDLYIDVGACSAEEASHWGIEPGTPAVMDGELTESAHPGRCYGKAVDNRAGLLVLFHVAEHLHGVPLPCRPIFVITVEEEIGLRGAAVAAARVRPDVVLAVDTVPAGGTPDLSPEDLPWSIGAGPLLKVRESKGLSTHRKLRELLVETAQAQSIPYQLIVDTAGITDATSAQQASGDVAAMVIGLARRYSHSAIEMFDLSDLEAMINLIESVVPRIENRSQFHRL